METSLENAFSKLTPPASPDDEGNKMSKTAISSTKSKDDGKRHCAFCLQVCGTPAKRCGKCKKRAYCSQECQQKDWSITGPGQGHKNWCGLHECGEEDVDWEVVPIPNKGLGIVAKKLLPTGFKIIVEAQYSDPKSHPGFMDLEPKDASLKFKFEMNSFDTRNDVLYGSLRISRINHGCRPNAGTLYDDGAKVSVLYAFRDIHPGEEIVMAYIPFTRTDEYRPTNEFKSLDEAFKFRETLLRGKGIVCPPECYCKNVEARKLVQEGIKINAQMEQLYRNGKIEKAIEVGEKLLDLQKRLDDSLELHSSTHFALFQLAISKKSTLAKADHHLKAALKICKNVNPYSKRTRMLEKYVDHPEAEINYLMAD